MPDLRSYAVELEREIIPPDFATLERVSRRRSRARAGATLALCTAALMAFVVVLTGGPAPDRGTLPAVGPTHSLSQLTPDEIVELGGDSDEVTSSDDGVEATLAAYQACPGDAGIPDTTGECRVAYRVTGPGGTHQTYVLTRANETLGTVSYLGRGEFIVYCTICGDEKAFYAVSAALRTPRPLPADGRPSRPGPGKTLVPCRGDTCIFDRTRHELAHLDLATLPYWIDELRTKTWFNQEPGTAVLPTGQVYIPPDILLGGGYGPSPALVITPGREARKLTPSPTKVPARPGLTGWVEGNGQGVGCPCVVDAEKATIAEVDLPADSSFWARSNANGWWGLSEDQKAAWVFVDGSPTKVTVPQRSPGRGYTIADGDATVIAYVEHVRNERADPSLFLHTSKDRGRTWRTLVMPISALGGGGEDGRMMLDPSWRTWPEAP